MTCLTIRNALRSSLGAFNRWAKLHPALFVTWQRRKPIVKQELLRSRWILSPTSRPHVDVGTAHGSPLDSSLWVSQEEFQFASTATPAGWLIRCANNGCPCRVAVRDLCVAYSLAEHNQLRYVGHNSEVAPPNRSNSIAEQTQSISSPHLIGGRWLPAVIIGPNTDSISVKGTYPARGLFWCVEHAARNKANRPCLSQPRRVRRLRHSLWDAFTFGRPAQSKPPGGAWSWFSCRVMPAATRRLTRKHPPSAVSESRPDLQTLSC
jgi:hypothetical protein